MTERSRPWDGTTVGDATDAPYDAATEWGRLFRALAPAAEVSANKGGVFVGASGFSSYAGTTPSANTARVASGVGWNQGTWHESDANVDIAIPTPSVSTRIDRLVLRKSWASQTIRVTRIAGTEGAGAPALTQVYGTTWDVPLWQVSITTGAVITFIDERLNLGVNRASGRVIGTTGTQTTSSGTYVDIPDMTITLTTTGGDVDVDFIGTFQSNTLGIISGLQIVCTGGTVFSGGQICVQVVNQLLQGICKGHVTGLPAGTYTFKTQWQTNAGIVTAQGNSRWMFARELP